MKTSVAVWAVVAAAVICGGCSRETVVIGQVFIVRADREVVRMGGARVVAEIEKAATGRVARVEREMEEWRNRKTEEAKQMRDQHAAAQDRYNTASAEYERVAEEAEKHERAAKARRNNIASTGRAMRFWSAAERAAGAEQNRKRLAEAEKFESEARTLRARADELHKEILAARTEINDLDGTRERIKKELMEGPSLALLKGDEKLPSVLTDADGRFTLPLPKRGRWVVMAHLDRQVLGFKENYIWAESVKGTNVVLLSSENIKLAWRSGEEKWLKELLALAGEGK